MEKTDNRVVSLKYCRTLSYVSKNVLKRKSATLKKYGGKLKNGGPKNVCGMCGVIALKSDNPCYVPCGSQHLASGHIMAGIHKQNSLVDLADFAPNVPCGERTCVLRMLGSREALLRTVFACSDW